MCRERQNAAKSGQAQRRPQDHDAGHHLRNGLRLRGNDARAVRTHAALDAEDEEDGDRQGQFDDPVVVRCEHARQRNWATPR